VTPGVVNATRNLSRGVGFPSSCTARSPVVIGCGSLGRPTGTVSPEMTGASTLPAHRPSAPVALSRWRRRFEYLPYCQVHWWSGCCLCRFQRHGLMQCLIQSPVAGWWSPNRSCSAPTMSTFDAAAGTLCSLSLQKTYPVSYVSDHKRAVRAARPKRKY
jgi:hypothetical protein